MNIKKAILYGFLCWLFIEIILIICRPFINIEYEYSTLLKLITIIISTGIFGTLYLRNLNKNEILEGFIGGIIFFLINMGCNLIFIIWPNDISIIFNNYLYDFIITLIIMPFILTVLGYFAQMPIRLK